MALTQVHSLEAEQLFAEQWERLVDALPAAVLVTSLDGRILRWLGDAPAIFGYSAAEAVGRQVDFVHRPDVRERTTALIIESIAATGRFVGEIPCLRKDGSEVTIETSAQALFGPDGRPQLLVGINRDVSDRVRAAQQHKELQRALRLQSVTAALASALTPAEVATVIVRNGIEALGAQAGSISILDESADRLRLLGSIGYPEDATERYRDAALDLEYPPARVVRTGTPLFLGTVEERRRAFPGLAHLIQSNGSGAMAALPLSVGERIIGALGFNFPDPRAFDEPERAFLTTLARLCGHALERSRLYERARQADRRKDEFLAVLGHELRNPLAPIVTALELMRMRDPDAFSRERGIIERQVRHVGRLVDDLLDISRITSGRVELRKELIDVGEVVARAIEMSSPIIEERRHRLDVQVQPELLVLGDSVRLAQCLANLLVNAARYTSPNGNLGISAQRSGALVEIVVRDDGVGLDAELQAKLFEPFVRGPAQVAQSPGGLGLGLAIVKGIVDQHEGQVHAESDGVQRGSRFVVRLPVALPAPSSTLANDSALRPRPVGAPKRVLVVDDNLDAGEMLVEILRMQGHEVRSAADGARALDIVRSFVPDVAVLDIGLPGMDGYELAATMRAMPELAATRLVALTGYGQRDDIERATAAGFDAHFVKPISPERLALLIER